MIAGVLDCSVNFRREEDIRAHLLSCDQHFIPP